MNQIILLISVGLAGAMGAMARYGIGVGTRWIFGETFPWGTLIVNVVGCFLLGIVAQSGSQFLSEHWRTVLGVGFLGALTTFSTFGVETVKQFEDGHLVAGSLNIFANLAAGLVAVVMGLMLARTFFPVEPS